MEKMQTFFIAHLNHRKMTAVPHLSSLL